MSKTLLEARDVKKHFPVNKGIILTKQIGAVKAVDGVNFSISQGETFGLVGESGCGKTTLSRLVLLDEELSSGSIFFEGKDTQQLSGGELKRYRAAVQAVFQDPYSSLNPRMRIGNFVSEPIVIHKTLSGKAITDRVAELLQVVGLRPESAELYPHEFSGGQRQRIAIARAIALNPSLVVLDEPVSSLDVSIRAQIMNLLRDIQQEFGLTYLLIAHDLAVVKHMSNRIGVMYLGKLVETAENEELYRNPLHPYTEALLSAALPSHPDHQRKEIILHGEVPSPLNPPPGCRFHTRCMHAKPICFQKEPILTGTAEHQVACHLHS
ncbi:MAG: dipeptide ABC transporter ATP-binding protein [Dehalococcoidia bacterium]|nr:dipeptide ABC transporter ATP-binding protein [Dehalococcoidia bacterium]